MLKNQKGFGIMDFLGIMACTLIIVVIILDVYEGVYKKGELAGMGQALGMPIQVEKLKQNTPYRLVERLSSPSIGNLSVVIDISPEANKKRQEIKIVADLPKNINLETVFISRNRGDDIYMYVKE